MRVQQHLLATKSGCVLALASLILLLMGCGSTQFLPSDREPVPASLTVDCPITPLPGYGAEWEDVAEVTALKDEEQLYCNCRMQLIRDWSDGTIAMAAGETDPCDAE